MSTRGLDELRVKAETGPRDGVMHVKRVRVLALLDDLAAAESRVADALTLHTGFHQCCGGDYYTDGEKYDGAIAKRGKCPTARALVGDETPGTGDGA